MSQIDARCVLVKERNAPQYTPHVVIHFGAPEEFPGRIQCSATVDFNQISFCIPIYAYNLWEGAETIELALHTPLPPTGFDPGPGIVDVEMHLDSDTTGTTTSFTLHAEEPLCGPILLGCFQIPTAGLPESFNVQLFEHQRTGRQAMQTMIGEWRQVVVNPDGAPVGGVTSSCDDPCPMNQPIRDLKATQSDRPGILDFSWQSGSGSFTLLRYRTDGRYPSDPWDGELLALLPTSMTSFSDHFNYSGDLHVAAWSVTRGPQGYLYAASNVECGSLDTVTAHMPIAVEKRSWQQMKSMFR